MGGSYAGILMYGKGHYTVLREPSIRLGNSGCEGGWFPDFVAPVTFHFRAGIKYIYSMGGTDGKFS